MAIAGKYTQRLRNSTLALLCVTTLLLSIGCKPEVEPEAPSGYPEEVDAILHQTCASPGCHTPQSAPAAAGLNLATWSDAYKGSRGGSPIIPYSPDKSILLYSTNSDTNLGPTLAPTMPLNQPALTAQQYLTLVNWIEDGARNADGEEAFPPQANRQKWYVGHRDCDHVAVFDAASRQIMRFISVGNSPTLPDETFDIQVAPDGEDWYVVFSGTNSYIQRYSTLTDEKVADIELGHYYWNTMTFSPDGNFAFVASKYWHRMAVVDLTQNQLVDATIPFPEQVIDPTVHPNRQEVYLVQPLNQKLYILDYDNAGAVSNRREVDLTQGQPATDGAALTPFEILFAPDGSQYFVTCWNSGEVRVFDGQTNLLTSIIHLPDLPRKMAYSPSTNRLFVSCQNDLESWNGATQKRGSVTVINAASHQIEQVLYTGYQPHALLVDEANGVLVVTNRNRDPEGPAPHHASTCGDRNGYTTLVDLNTLELVPDYKPELLANPITIAGKF